MGNNPNLRTLVLTSPLPIISDDITLNGRSQPGFAGTPVIEINSQSITIGSQLTGGALFVLDIHANNSSVFALILNRYVNASREDDRAISFSAGGNNVVEGCYIGSNASCTAGYASGSTAPSSTGIYIEGSSDNRIGGTTAVARNFISGNGSAGIVITGDSTRNSVQGNYIGPDITGDRLLPGRQNYGVWLQGVSDNVIGGTAPGAGNLISGNNVNGVYLSRSARNNLIVVKLFSFIPGKPWRAALWGLRYLLFCCNIKPLCRRSTSIRLPTSASRKSLAKSRTRIC